MKASFEDAQKLSAILRKAFTRKRLTQADRDAYEELHERLLSDAPEKGRSASPLMQSVQLPATLAHLERLVSSPVGPAATSRFTDRFRQVSDLLLERDTGDPGRHVRLGTGPREPRTPEYHPPSVEQHPVVRAVRSASGVTDPSLEQAAAQSGEPLTVDSAAWTGLETGAAKARAVLALIPSSIAAVEALLVHYRDLGGNGGPPLDGQETLLDDLRELHTALGKLLAAAESGNHSGLQDGFIGSAAAATRRIAAGLKEDILPIVVMGTVEATLAYLGVPLAGTATELAKRVAKRAKGD